MDASQNCLQSVSTEAVPVGRYTVRTGAETCAGLGVWFGSALMASVQSGWLYIWHRHRDTIRATRVSPLACVL